MSPNSQRSISGTAQAEEIRHTQESLEEHSQIVEVMYLLIRDIEDDYRKLGVQYHKTNMNARNPEHGAVAELQRLKKAFELTSEDEYNTYFALHRSGNQLLDRLRDETRPNSTLEVLEQRRQNFYQKLPYCTALMEKIMEEAEALQKAVDQITACHAELMYRSWGLAWWSPVRSLPHSEGEEWAKFCEWVWCLPETKRAVQAGGCVHDVAKKLLAGIED